ncbi:MULTISPECIES: hypothetical protein [unclassified Olleya]|jgi:multisubunit Na+/H+ antiporter MnhB subunit|uniref:hypothetical protein n=1 Tax=unclassified Olleya TaxID=2615019 RepID=UPI0011AA6D3D|nr:hypothetical protein [Olleya sp. Hel_I_94]TVZ48068.1 hypothetical protein JM82_2699 [Olleya sp. Hel_I_94]
MKLSKENIQFIDNYLIRLKIKYVDVRLELIDHLASDFEASNKEEQLVDYLKSKIDFIKDFEKKRQKTIHWSYQREMWRRLAMFFYKPNYLPFTIVFGFAVYWMQQFQPNKAFTLILIVSLSIIHFWALITGFSHYKTFKKLQMAQPLYSIMALPSLFLYTMGVAKPWLENQYFFIAFWFLAILFNIAGGIELRNKKNKILEYSKNII